MLEEARLRQPEVFDESSFKALSNTIRKNIVVLLYKEGKLKFSQIQKTLRTEDATKLSFHLRKLKDHEILSQDAEKKVFLEPKRKKTA